MPLFIWLPIVITFIVILFLSAVNNAAEEKVEEYYAVDKEGNLVEYFTTHLETKQTA